MPSKHDLKVLLRSRSLQFMRDRDPQRFAPGQVASFAWHGKPVHYRPGSSDPEVIYKILLKGGKKSEYYVPESLAPKVIWDIGANIGAASRYFAERFPQAQIHSFEPVPDNVAILERNVAGNPAIRVHALALGAEDGELAIVASDYARNFGGFSFHYTGQGEPPTQKVPMMTPARLMAERGVPAPDLIKIDVEGAEYGILTAFPQELLARVTWIVGELHSQRSFALLEYLAQWFDIDTKKSMGKPLFGFNARNKANPAR
jgi:FkbM family methyltransferase